MDKQFKVGAYIRLSKEDSHEAESESITNQRNLIKEYLKHHDLNLSGEYIDDGYTGTTFERPGFVKLINDIEDGKINMVITKDLSRLGRNYVKSGYYIEEYFPGKKVRYVSILDNVDTLYQTSNNDIAPFKALFNDMVSKDTSQKIKEVLKSKKKQGLYLGAQAPYGYQKDPLNKHRLVQDIKTTKIVKKIYTYFLNGKSINSIADILNQKKIPSPSKYKNKKEGLWTYTSVYNILKNEIYTGKTIQNVWTNLSYKNKTRIKRNKQEWIIHSNSHKPIISSKTFSQVQEKIHHKNPTPIKKRKKLLLEGLVYCADCGYLMGANYNKKSGTWHLICNNYKRNSHLKNCTSHYLNYNNLENSILEKLNKLFNLKSIPVDNSKREKIYINKLNILYEDRLNEIITLEKYKELKNKYDKELNGLKESSKLTPNRDLVKMLINKITVNREKEIKIYYKFKKPKN